MKNKAAFLIVLIPVLIVVLGMIGYCCYLGNSFYEGLLSSLKLLKAEFGGTTNNFFVEAARWLGIIFYFSILYAIFHALFNSIKMFLNMKHKNSVAVHGDSSMAQLCTKSIHNGKHCINSDTKASFYAKKQIIWFEDDARSLQFLEKNKSKLKKAEVYIALNTIPVEGSTDNNVHFFNVNENIASNYWENHFITESRQVTMIGSGALAEEMLEQALLMNVFSQNGGVRYHVIGNMSVYRALHPALDEAVKLANDELTFSDTPWFEQLDTIRSSDLIILTGRSGENTEIARMLLNYGIRTEIHLMAESEDTGYLFRGDNVTIFGTLKEAIGEDGESLFQDGIHQAGKMFDAIYNVVYDGISHNVKSEEIFSRLSSKTPDQWCADNTGWADMSSFLKRSNYSAAKHSAVKKEILKKALAGFDAGTDYDEFIKSGFKAALDFWGKPENLALIECVENVEHLRWWRLYLLNNFTYDENVESKDKWVLRRNKNMKPYSMLDEKTRRYDGIHYWLLPYMEKKSD